MKPDVDQILGLTAARLMGEIAPAMTDSYGQSAASMLAVMMMLSAQEYDRAAEIRAADNTEMRALFADLASSIFDAPLRGEVEAAAATVDTSLRISALDQNGYVLKRLLIRVQAHMEEHNSAGDKRIWEFLRRMAGRRTLSATPGA